LIQLLDQDLLILGLLGVTAFKETGGIFGQDLLPLQDLIGMDFILTGDLGNSLLAPESFQGNFGLKGRTVFAATAFHFCFLSSSLILGAVFHLNNLSSFWGPVSLVNLLWTDGEKFIPVDYRVYHRENDDKTKNDHFQEMLIRAKQRGFNLLYVLMDCWYASIGNLKLITVNWDGILFVILNTIARSV
jgi:hypothetical protein